MRWRWVVLAVLAIAGLVSAITVAFRESAARDIRSTDSAAKGAVAKVRVKSATGQPLPRSGAVDPSVFAQNACVAFAPTAGDRNLSVFLDAGHGGPDPGAVGTTQSGQSVYEADVTLPIELDTMAILRGDGFRVVVSRLGSTSVVRLSPTDLAGDELSAQGVVDDVGARARCANVAGADLLVGIYLDAASSPKDAGSITGYDAVRPFAAQNLHLAELLQTDVLAAMNAMGWGIPNDGVLPDTVLGSAVDSADRAYGHLILLGPAKAGYFATPSEMPGALIEPLFLSDPFEASLAVSARGQEVIAGGLAQAIEQYFQAPGARSA